MRTFVLLWKRAKKVMRTSSLIAGMGAICTIILAMTIVKGPLTWQSPCWARRLYDHFHPYSTTSHLSAHLRTFRIFVGPSLKALQPTRIRPLALRIARYRLEPLNLMALLIRACNSLAILCLRTSSLALLPQSHFLQIRHQLRYTTRVG